MATCTLCNKPLRSGAGFCPHCGAPVEPGKVSPVAKKIQISRQSKTKSARQQQQSRTNAVSKKQVNRRALIIKTVAISLAKSLALSAAVLGPGMMLLMSDEPVIGMIWLFVGSFALMAWTYRKPWRLGLFSCSIPPTAAAFCYLVQLTLFDGVLPPLPLLGVAVLIGVGVGLWRAQTHKVTRAEDGGIIAQRTIAYLLVWVMAYGVTQILGLLAADAYAIRAGLVTGAFSTAMLGVVSVVIWRRFNALKVSALLLLVGGFMLMPTPDAQAAPGICSKIDSSFENYVTDTMKSYGLPGKRRIERTQHNDYFCGVTVVLDTPSHADSSFSLNVVKPYRYKREDLSKLEKEGYFQKVEFQGLKTVLYRFEEGRGYSGVAYYTKFYIVRDDAYLEFMYSFHDSIGVHDAKQAEIAAYNIVVKAASLLLFDLKISSQLIPPVPVFDSSSVSSESTDTSGENRVSSIREEQVVTVSVAVSVILIVAGVAINVAQAIAAALANALQAGAQFTSEEIQQNISDALLDSSPGGSTKPQTASAVDQAKLSNPPPDIEIPGGQNFDRNDDGQYLAPDENGDWQWMSESGARKASEALWQEEAKKNSQRAEHVRETEKIREQWRRDTQEHYAGERTEKARERAEREAAFDQYERVERAATRVGDFDILMRTGEERVFKQDGSIDTDYLDRVRKALRGRIGRDVVMPDAKLADNSLNRIFKETFDDSMDDATNSFVVRVVAGMASGGTSEVAFQGREMWNAVKKAAEDAEDKGREMSAWDSATVVTTKIAKDNLPLNTLDALNRMRKGEDVSLAELGMSAVADLFSAAELAQTMGVNTGELLENFGRRVLSEDAMKNAANIHSQATAGAENIYRKAQNAADRANQAFDSALERLGLKKPSGRLNPEQAAARFENGQLTSGTNEIIESVQSNPSRSILEADQAFQAGRARGRQRIENLSSAIDELDAARKSGKANPAKISDLEDKVRAEVVRIQADKHAMNEMNRLPKSADGNNPLIKTFNGEIQKIHSQADRKMIERLAKEYGVRPEDIQPVTITNMAGEAGVKVDPAAPPRDHYGQASSWEGGGTIEHSRAARSAPGTVDGLETGRLPDTPTGAAKSNKVSFDRDLTMRVRSIENGRVVYRDIPSSTTARIYNEEFFEAATGRPLATKRGPEVAGLSAESANKLGHSIDFKDTHLNADTHLADIMALDDPDLFAKRMDQATTDRLHPEAYGTGQADLDTATKDSFRGRDLTDAEGTAKTVEFKVHHWLNEADSLREMAAATSDPAARSRLLEQAVAHQEEAQRQLIKQYGNMAIKRTDAMQLLDNARGARIPQDLSERINVLKRTQLPLSKGGLTSAQAEAVLNRMGSGTKQVAGQLSAYVEGLQKLRNPSMPKTSGPTIVFQGWQDDFKTEQSA